MIVDVKARKGRVAFTAPRGGVLIPEDKYITTSMTPWLKRLVEVHGDVEVKQLQKAANASQTPAKDEKKSEGTLKFEKKDEK